MFKTTQELLDYAVEKTPYAGEPNYAEMLVQHILQTLGGMLPREHAELNGLTAEDTMRKHMAATKSLIEEELKVKIFPRNKVSVLQNSPLRNYQPTEEPEMPVKKTRATKKATTFKKKGASRPAHTTDDTENTETAAKKPRAQGRYAPKGKTGRVIWDALENGIDTPVKAGEVEPRTGTANEEVLDVLKTFGRKKVTAQKLILALEAEGWPTTKAANYVSGGLNIGILDEA